MKKKIIICPFQHLNEKIQDRQEMSTKTHFKGDFLWSVLIYAFFKCRRDSWGEDNIYINHSQSGSHFPYMALVPSVVVYTHITNKCLHVNIYTLMVFYIMMIF